MQQQQRTQVFFVTIVASIVSMILFYLALVNHWFGEFNGTADVFCEATHKGLIKQPVNTWSNLGFMLAGLRSAWLLKQGRFIQNTNLITTTLFFSIFLPVFMVLLCPGSMAMHATMTTTGGFFDMLSMYLIASFMAAYASIRFFKTGLSAFFLIFICCLVVCLYAHFANFTVIFLDFSGNAAFAGFIVLASAMEGLNVYVRKYKHEKKWGFLAIFSMLFSLVIWSLSKTGGLLCDPSFIVQGHGIWHLLDALAIFSLFRYYVSEQQNKSSVKDVR